MGRGSWAGIALALAACAGGHEVEFHLLDGGSGELLALDRRGLVVARADRPGARLLARDGEALWIAGEGERGGWLERQALGAAPVEPTRLAFRAPRALAPGADGDLYLLDGAAGERARLWQVEPWLATRFLGEFEGGARLAWDGRALLLGTQQGGLLRLRGDGAVLETVEFGAPVVALEAAAGGDGGFLLLGGTAPRLARFERTLAQRWTVALGAPCAGFAVGGERVWVVEGELLLRFGPQGARELVHELPLRGGPWRACAAEASRVWLRGSGAWLELDSAGPRAWIVRAQGGFEALSAGVRRRAAARLRRAASSRRGLPRARAPASA